MSEKEKDEIDRLASIMHGLHLTMKAKPKISSFGAREVEYAYEPPFDELLAYSDAPIEDNYHVLAPTVAEIVAHQITLKDMRGKGEGGPAAAAITTPAKGDSQSGENGRGMKRATPSSVVAVDFFGRKIIPTTSEKKKKRKLKKAVIAHFRFKEGFTNAVRRAVSIKDLF